MKQCRFNVLLTGNCNPFLIGSSHTNRFSSSRCLKLVVAVLLSSSVVPQGSLEQRLLALIPPASFSVKGSGLVMESIEI